jgi:4-hydroxyproline epimerase
MPQRAIRVLDSHTEGEPTRLVVEGLPALASTTVAGKADELRREHDGLRAGIAREPRGHEALVGAFLFEPDRRDADLGVVFFNNAGYLGMCGHGTIGVVASLAHLGKLKPGEVRLETPAGIVRAQLHEDGRVTVWNVESYRLAKGAEVEVRGYGKARGDVAYGGNWFFLVEEHGLEVSLANLEALMAFGKAVRQALGEQGVTGAHGAEIDHVELFGPPSRKDCDSKNFVLCPGLAYDRSPCGTGLSAKLACLAADGKLAPGEVWRQESLIGSAFDGSYEWGTREAIGPEAILPAITGRAWITGETTLLFDPDDPYAEGIGP